MWHYICLRIRSKFEFYYTSVEVLTRARVTQQTSQRNLWATLALNAKSTQHSATACHGVWTVQTTISIKDIFACPRDRGELVTFCFWCTVYKFMHLLTYLLNPNVNPDLSHHLHWLSSDRDQSNQTLILTLIVGFLIGRRCCNIGEPVPQHNWTFSIRSKLLTRSHFNLPRSKK